MQPKFSKEELELIIEGLELVGEYMSDESEEHSDMRHALWDKIWNLLHPPSNYRPYREY